MCQAIFNPHLCNNPEFPPDLTAAFERLDISDCHQSFSEYQPTPLVSLPALAAKLNLGEIRVKDESRRFGLKAFKVLGAAYAITRFLHQNPRGDYIFCTATDGNHGRAVAWTARQLAQKAIIYMPRDTVPARIEAIRGEGAMVHIVDGSYDDAVRQAVEEAQKNGWQMIADTAWPGYTFVPADIMAGYTTLFAEMERSIHFPDKPGVDFVFLPAGVGSFAAAGVWYYLNRYGHNRPRLIIVEPTEAACLLESIRAGEISVSRGSLRTIMAGLNCGTPSLLAWPFLKSGADLFMAVSDKWAEEAMRTCYYPTGKDPRIISGESG